MDFADNIRRNRKMTIKELQNALVAAMKEKNRVKKTVIADMITTSKNMAIEKHCKDDITEEIVNAAILKVKKACKEQIESCPANRPDLLEGFQVCMGYIEKFAPKMLSEDEIKAIIGKILAENDVQVTNKGVIMKLVMPELKGKADGKIISKIVDEVVKQG